MSECDQSLTAGKIPSLSSATRGQYRRIWSLHVLPRLGKYGVRELTPKRLTRFRAELEKAGVGAATIVKAVVPAADLPRSNT